VDVLLSAVAIVSAEVSVVIAYLQLTGDQGENGWRDSIIAALVSIACVTGLAKRPVRSSHVSASAGQ
jgi:hypothetical protein